MMTHETPPTVPDDELTWRFSRSSGPGGQHVNTSDTRVELSWVPSTSRVLTPAQQARVAAALRARLTTDGTLRIVSSQFRSQLRNREAARRRLDELVAAALVPPRVRRPTRPSKASGQRRIEAKKQRGRIKADRRRPDW